MTNSPRIAAAVRSRFAYTATFLLLAAALASAQSAAPQAAESAPALTLSRRADAMLTEALRSENAHAILARLCQHAPRRLTGSPGFAAALEWAHQELEGLGVDAIRRQKVMVPRWVRGKVCEVRLADPPDGGPGRLRCIALGGSIATPPEGITAGIIAVRDFDELKRRRAEAKGKIVLFNEPFDHGLRHTGLGYAKSVRARALGAIEAAKAGAVCALVRSAGSRLDDTPHTGMMRYQDGVPKIPSIALSPLAARRVGALLDAGHALTVTVRADCRTLPDVPSANLIAEIRGREKPEEIVVIGAHLDAWDVGHGAHDDGSGVAHCLEAARILLQQERRPRRTVRIVLFVNEENGLRGGRAYAAEAEKRGEIENHVLALETDSGGFSPRGFGLTAGEGAVESLAEIDALLARLGLGGVFPRGGGADITPLMERGVPVGNLRVSGERYFDFHHTERDTLDQVHPRELAKGAGALAIFTWAMADREETLSRRPPAGTR